MGRLGSCQQVLKYVTYKLASCLVERPRPLRQAVIVHYLEVTSVKATVLVKARRLENPWFPSQTQISGKEQEGVKQEARSAALTLSTLAHLALLSRTPA
ncbi:hypothetical protein E2C01_100378 [Portunus trituberculatus]|uniref:Uncharacterized protein n=1 Tax=Portunus trituberculatus TaxID=210409 RepID=A0A5B7KDF4_PORTR|nr:hypothetical protein [Portunus trituberculatus]